MFNFVVLTDSINSFIASIILCTNLYMYLINDNTRVLNVSKNKLQNNKLLAKNIYFVRYHSNK